MKTIRENNLSAKRKRYPICGPYTRLSVAKKCGHLTVLNRHFCVPCSTFFKRKKIACQVCGKNFETANCNFKRGRKFCSRECYSKTIADRQRGSKSHLWQGGKTAADRLLRNSVETANWRKAVFARDGYKCVACGIGGRLSADHIKPWSLFPALRFDVSNGRTLCWPCHRKIGVNPGQWTRDKKDAFIASIAV